MKKKTPSINEIVEYGLDSLDPNETINVNIKDLIYIYKSFEEFNRFFHQPLHFKKLDDIVQYLGNKDEGAYSIIHKVYYKIFDRMLPPHIKDIVEDDDFQHPEYPFYYEE